VAALLRRRVAPLLVLAVVIALLPAAALASGRAVLADYRDNGRIDSCYTLADYQQALRLVRPDQAQYGALVDVILNAQVTNLKVAGQPCRPQVATTTATDQDDDGGGSSTFLWVGVVLAVGVVAIGAGALARRRRGGGGGGGGDQDRPGGDGGTEG